MNANVCQSLYEDPGYPSLGRVVVKVAQDAMQAVGLLLGARGLLIWALWNHNLSPPVSDPFAALDRAKSAGPV